MESNNPTPPSQPVRLHYHMILAEVVFMVGDQLQIVNRQFYEKSDMTVFRAHRVHGLQNTAAFQVRETLPAELRPQFRTMDVFIKSIIPLGCMTDAEFWEGMGREDEVPPMAANVDAQVAAEAVQAAGNIPVDGMGRSATVTPIRPIPPAPEEGGNQEG